MDRILPFFISTVPGASNFAIVRGIVTMLLGNALFLFVYAAAIALAVKVVFS